MDARHLLAAILGDARKSVLLGPAHAVSIPGLSSKIVAALAALSSRSTCTEATRASLSEKIEDIESFNMPVSLLIHPGTVTFSAFQNRNDLIQVGQRRNIDRIESTMPNTELFASPFVRTSERLQFTPIFMKARLVLIYQEHVSRVSTSSDHTLEVDD
jgi:hypothetical protein